jgi:UDP-GlcNAc:undecaprenyl-phosphate GlcNAc-1-phosphate transferase
MPSEADAVTALLIAAALTALVTPVMSHVASNVGIFDHPVGYKRHERPTPYLGGVAVLLGVLAAILAMAGVSTPVPAVAAGAAAICVVGTLDDWRPTSPVLRLTLHAVIGGLIWEAGAGWGLDVADWVNLLLTIGWVVLATNIFNLIDNLDGTSAAAAAGSALGITAIAMIDAPGAWPAVLAAAVLGASLGFLPYNLAKPARIFLGDGGSTLLGFLLAVAAMGALRVEAGPIGLIAAILLVAAPLFDTALTFGARRRRGVPLLTGGRDHVTHRIHARVGSARRTAAAVALAQAAFSAIAVATIHQGVPALPVAAALLLVAVSGGIVVWRGRLGSAPPSSGPLPTMRRAG